MGVERRRDARSQNSLYAELIVRGRSLPCVLLNASEHGIYARLTAADEQRLLCVDSDAIVMLRKDDGVVEGAGGKVLRREEAGGDTFVALYFNRPVNLSCLE